jgi:hypothetical protein
MQEKMQDVEQRETCGMGWKRVLAAGSLAAGAALLLSGRRKAALAATGLGAAALLAEEPEMVRRLWRNAPQYLEDGRAALDRLEAVMDGVAEQSSRARSLLRRA